MHLCGGFCLVVGSTWMVSTVGDFPFGDSIGGSECNRVDEHDLHVRDCASVSDDVVSYEVWVVHILRFFCGGDVDFRLLFLAGD